MKRDRNYQFVGSSLISANNSTLRQIHDNYIAYTDIQYNIPFFEGRRKPDGDPGENLRERAWIGKPFAHSPTVQPEARIEPRMHCARRVINHYTTRAALPI